MPPSRGGSVINNYSHSYPVWMLDHWPAMAVLLGLVVLVGSLALVVHWANRRDEAARVMTYRWVDPSGRRPS